jgi:tetratricopeptide (TPR) repeat protein
MPLTPIIFDKITELFQEAYPVSRDATIYAEVVTGEMNYKGMGELRDALEHLNRAISTEDEECALENLTEAYEHLRRSGVESVQRAATKLYSDCIVSMKTPSIVYKLAFLEVPDKGKVRDLRMKAMRKIKEGRIHKSNRNDWTMAIEDFTQAIDLCIELGDMFPSESDAKYRVILLILGIIGAASVILNIYQYFGN